MAPPRREPNGRIGRIDAVERSTFLVSAAVGVTVAVSVFAVARAVVTDDEIVAPPPVVTTLPAPTTTTPGGATESVGPTAVPAAPARIEIDISGFAFSPEELTIAVGTEVVWTNGDSAKHTVTANEGAFDSPVLEEGDTFSFVFTTPGTFAYFCNFHPDMTATITVEG